MKPFRKLTLASCLALWAGIPFGGTAAAADLDLLLAREPVELTTTQGRSFRGTLDGVRDDRVHLRRATDGGEVGYSFALAEIARVTLPGIDLEGDAVELLERGRTAEALPLLEALGRHRIRYLPLLDAARRDFLWEAARVCSVSGDPHTALAIVRAMEPLATSDDLRLSLLEAGLQVALRLGRREEATTLAVRWCALADPAGDSALGWSVLARIALEDGRPDRARWLALEPVAFSGHLPMRELDRCYVLAIAAADRLGDPGHAFTLRREMRARGLAWPAESEWAALDSHYSDAGPPARTLAPPPAVRAGPDAPAGTPDAVRRLARAAAP